MNLNRPLTLQSDEDITKFYNCGEKMYNALQSFLKSEGLKCLLEVNDPIAHKQAREAIDLYEKHLFHL